jgi:hypothetical protein
MRPNSNGNQTIEADEKQPLVIVDHEPPRSQSKEEPGKRSRHVYWLLVAASALMFLLSFLLAKNEPGVVGRVALG